MLVRIRLNGLCNDLAIIHIDLVECQHAGHAASLEIGNDILLHAGDLLAGVHHHDHGIRLIHGVVCFLDHIVTQLVLRTVNTGGIDKYVLILAHGMNTRDAVTCGLGLGGHDCHLFAQNCVEQRGLAHVGSAHDCDKSCFSHVLISVDLILLYKCVYVIAEKIHRFARDQAVHTNGLGRNFSAVAAHDHVKRLVSDL